MARVTVHLQGGESWQSPDPQAKVFMLAEEEILVVESERTITRFPLMNVMYWVEARIDASRHPSTPRVVGLAPTQDIPSIQDYAERFWSEPEESDDTEGDHVDER
jgi:hypothetical protein